MEISVLQFPRGIYLNGKCLCARSYSMLVFLLSLSCGVCQMLLQNANVLLGSAMGQYQFSGKHMVCLLQVLQSVEYRCDHNLQVPLEHLGI